ncbi:glycoside hydrolase family 3 N-terminal domain-containing protein [Glaciihabitans sp. dw_435]|uniref:glycoside hydrolase family 3 N-terminal domain-containing protein n=1 Tax=Glaciihabitans sp. dw_435 TaxID=2720081 RepID=UPI001BD6253A|nr:glycoside hydrolase family 3 N-terminal domain-containing protein [Glaciihabitans sp. dw_435]
MSNGVTKYSRRAVAGTVFLLAAGVTLTGCVGSGTPSSSGSAGSGTSASPTVSDTPTGAPTASATASSTPSSSPTSAPSSTPTSGADPLAGLTLEQRVGQLFMVGTTATAAEGATIATVRDRHVGNIFLSGRSSAGTTATATVVRQFTNLVRTGTTGGIPMLVSTDQEGGQVQVLHGPGFSTMPSGLEQGAGSTAALEANAATWGAQLRSAGVTMNLAPVVDLIPNAKNAAANAPIGAFDREYGFTAATITGHADAFRGGMESAGVQTVVKHFPGLGTVTKNTDTTANVTDTTTTADSASVGIYRTEIADGAPSIMVSSAIYSKIDATQPAVFSRAVVTDLLRGSLGFDGVVMTDDLSGATQVLSVSPGDRAIRSIQAGVDIVLVSRIPTVAPGMIDAVVDKARTDPDFDALVDAAARRVLVLKHDSLG